MKLGDYDFQNHWNSPPQKLSKYKIRAEKVRKNFPEVEHCGSESEPESTLWLSSLSSAMEKNFDDGLVILDYGCGIGRYADFVNSRIKKFKYYGVEKANSENRHGENCLKFARKIYGYNRKIKFGMIDTKFEKKAIKISNVSVLGSVFTHLDALEIMKILTKLMPIVKTNQGKIIFSAFIAETFKTEGPGIYGFKNVFHRSYITQQFINDLEKDFEVKIEAKEDFLAQGENLHTIFSVEDR